MIKFEIDTRDLAEVKAALEAWPEQANRALARAINKTTAWASSQGLRAIARTHDIPLKSLRARRRGKVRRATIASLTGTAWFGTLPIAASYIGAPRQTRKGARAGSRLFPDAFVATVPSGHVGIYTRGGKGGYLSRWTKGRPHTSSPNLPILEAAVPLDSAASALETIQAQLADRLQATFAQEMNYELNVRGR